MIEIIKKSMQEIIEEDNLTEYIGLSMEDLFRVYSSDFCEVLLYYFPKSSVMIKDNYLECGLLIDDLVYDSSGVTNKLEYTKANMEDIRFISRSFNHLSGFVLKKLFIRVNDSLVKDYSYFLRKNKKN